MANKKNITATRRDIKRDNPNHYFSDLTNREYTNINGGVERLPEIIGTSNTKIVITNGAIHVVISKK